MKQQSKFYTLFLIPLASVQITVVCLFLLFVLTLWGTIAQVHQGLYIAQERFFNSFYFMAGGFFPFPGAQLVLWVMFFNLVAATITRFRKYKNWSYAGILLTHFGLWLYFIAAFVTFQLAKESNVRLAEGSSTNVSTSYTEWEIAYWKEKDFPRKVTAIDTRLLHKGKVVPFSNVQWQLKLDEYYPNAIGFTKALPADGKKYLNASGITVLQSKKIEQEREKNTAGAILTFINKGEAKEFILYGSEDEPMAFKVGEETVYFALRHTKFQLPFKIKLDEFKAEFHPGTQMAKSYESWVEVIKSTGSRKAHIYMNNPLREKDYALYQSSYDVDDAGNKHSTLAVVKNAGSFLPYVACMVVFLGLALHLLISAFRLPGAKK